MLDTKEKPVEGKVTEPAKQWRNRWLVTHPCRGLISGTRRYPGDIYSGLRAWPSKDVAEQKASDELAQQEHDFGHTIKDHLGAFPVTP